MQPPPRRRVFAETVDYGRLRQPDVLDALAQRGMQLVLAARGDDDPAPVIADARNAGVGVALWPMLADEDGRWASTASAPRFVEHARRLVEGLADAGQLPDELCIDLEPPFGAMRRTLDGALPRTVSGSADDAIDLLARLIAELDGLGVATWAAVVPLVLADRPHRPMWQRWIGTPVDALPLVAISTMLYTSLVTGYARGALDRDAALGLLGITARRALARFGPRAAIALGATGVGALGDEAVYRSPDELARDVAVVRAAGIDDIALFDLGGALRRGPLAAWLDPLVEPAEAIVERTSLRARALGVSVVAASHAGALGTRVLGRRR